MNSSRWVGVLACLAAHDTQAVSMPTLLLASSPPPHAMLCFLSSTTKQVINTLRGHDDKVG